MIGLQRIGLKTFNNESIFNITAPTKKDEFILKNVSGLTGSNLNVNFQKTLYSGSVHMGSRREEREITMLIQLNPDRANGRTVEDLRDDIYAHIISDEVVDRYTEVMLYGSKHNLVTYGRISQIEADLYSQVPLMQVSIRCRYAHFLKTVAEPASTITVTGSNVAVYNINNPGAPTGFIAEGTSSQEFSTFALHNETNGQSIQVSGAPTIEGTQWKFKIDTTPENRTIQKQGLRDNVWYFNTLYDKASIPNGYVQLESGMNRIVMSIDGVDSRDFSLVYRQRFNGV